MTNIPLIMCKFIVRSSININKELDNTNRTVYWNNDREDSNIKTQINLVAWGNATTMRKLDLKFVTNQRQFIVQHNETDVFERN